jgi:cell division protein FtsW
MQRVQKFTGRSAVQSDSNGYAPDIVLLTAVLLILSVGILFVYSTSSITAEKNFGSAHFYLLKQAVFAFIGLGVMVTCAYVDYHKWLKLTPFFYVGALIGLLIVLSGLGHSAGGSSRWIRLGGISVQPSEFGKMALIFYLSHSLANRRDKVESFKEGFVPSLVISGILLGLTLLQPDFGTTMVMALIMVILLFVAGTKLSHLIGAALTAAPVVYAIMFGAEYRRKRILAYLNPWNDPNGIGFQIIQSYIAFGSGGLTGRGLGDGRQKLFFLPEAHTDFIFAVFGEETGFVGVLFLVLLYGIIVWRGLSIAMNAKDEYGTFLATGITAMFGIQSFVNMAVVTGLLPTKGLTLPLISYGGSALVMNLMALGLLQSVHIHSRRAA